MEEHRVTVDGEPHDVPRPFMVMATQNPVDMDGTYELPEAQLDRFLLRLSVGYPDLATEVDILKSHRAGTGIDRLTSVLPVEHVRAMIAMTTEVHVADAIHHYIARLTAATRDARDVRLGASPRGSIALMRAGRAMAAAEGRGYVTPEDVQALAVPVLAHRLILTPEAEVRGTSPAAVIARTLREIPVPSTADAA